AKTVKDAVVGIEAAGDGADAGFSDLPPEPKDVGAQAAEIAVVESGYAQRRIAAADQVEAAVQDAVAVDLAVGHDAGLGRGLRPEPRKRGRRREQLHVRCQRAPARGGLCADRPARVSLAPAQATR